MRTKSTFGYLCLHNGSQFKSIAHPNIEIQRPPPSFLSLKSFQKFSFFLLLSARSLVYFSIVFCRFLECFSQPNWGYYIHHSENYRMLKTIPQQPMTPPCNVSPRKIYLQQQVTYFSFFNTFREIPVPGCFYFFRLCYISTKFQSLLGGALKSPPLIHSPAHQAILVAPTQPPHRGMGANTRKFIQFSKLQLEWWWQCPPSYQTRWVGSSGNATLIITHCLIKRNGSDWGPAEADWNSECNMYLCVTIL